MQEVREARKVIDISSELTGPAAILSNFSPHPFDFLHVGKPTFEIQCASMEGFLQRLKFENPQEQKEVFQLVGKEAKKAGRARNEAWQKNCTFWLNGTPDSRLLEYFQFIVTEAFTAMTYDERNEALRKALLETVGHELTHTIGSNDPTQTILTEQELCFQLVRCRALLLNSLNG